MDQRSIFPTRSALLSMKWRRGSTSSPMSMVNTRSASLIESPQGLVTALSYLDGMRGAA